MSFNRFRKHFQLVAPSWVVKQVERNQLPSSALLDLSELVKICSMEDLAIMLCLNTEEACLFNIFGPGVQAQLPGLAEHWSRYYPSEYAKVCELIVLYRESAMERLLQTPDSQGIDGKPELLLINAPECEAAAICIILKPGHLGGTDQREVQQYIVREYMRQLYVFTDYATIAQDALFVRYLNNVVLDDVSEPA